MEAAPNKNENVEKIDAYHEKREAGHARGQEKIQNIDGFEQMDYREQFAVLSELLQGAEDAYEEDFIAAHLEHIKIQMKKEDLDGELDKIKQYYDIAV